MNDRVVDLVCPTCTTPITTYLIKGERPAHPYQLHLKRCRTASDEERAYYRRMGRWPEKKKAA